MQVASESKRRAFVLRMAPRGADWVPEALAADEISIGWGEAAGLMEPALDYWKFRDVVKRDYYPDAATYQQAGSVAGMLWLFIREMQAGDLVVVPHEGKEFYVSSVAGMARYLPDEVSEHTAFRRQVTWLNDKRPIPRRNARAALQSRMKSRQTLVDASHLVDEILDALENASTAVPAAFGFDLRSRLIEQARAEITSGRMDSFGFENLVAALLRSMKANEVRVVPRSLDKGVDIIATFSLADTFPIRLAVQAKHFRPEPPVGPSVVDQLVAGMEAEQISLGWVATSGSFSEEAVARKTEIEESRGISIELVDGDQLAAMIVEGGLRAVGFHDSQQDTGP
jgi:predicted Mrr-cat superfamily restriction endonuclease